MIWKLGLGSAIIAFSLILVSCSLHWYWIRTRAFEAKYYWTYYIVTFPDEKGNYVLKYTEGTRKALYGFCLSFLTFGGALMLAYIILMSIKLYSAPKYVRNAAFICGCVASVFLSISYLSFLGLPQVTADELRKDGGNVCELPYCKSFSGSDGFGTHWGPAFGWWALLAATIFAILATGCAYPKMRSKTQFELTPILPRRSK